jgi:phosphoenolpyruvate synthase/pyruvate phosphate dikinase
VNTIREGYPAEVAALLPVLHATYRSIGRYQRERTPRLREEVLAGLAEASDALRFFQPHVPRPKQAYFTAAADEALPLSDRIIALDVAVGAMHIEFSMERAYMHRESEALRRALELSRVVEGEAPAAAPEGDDVLARGIAASPGIVTGKAALIRRNADYRRVPAGAIAVARMTRPELVLGLGRLAGIVTDLGGSLCHAAIIARELSLPCVVGTGDATTRIRPGQLVLVNGTEGVVRAVPRAVSVELDAKREEVQG